MLVEFRKLLERQLLGAPAAEALTATLTSTSTNPPSRGGQAPLKNETAGSKERREKLYGFILHLEETMGQIAEGFASEELKSTTTLEVGTATAGSTTLDDEDKDTQSPPR